MSAFVTHLSYEFRTGIRDRSLLLMTYLFPLGFFLMMGFVMPGLNPFFLGSMIPSMVVFATLAATLLGLPEPLVHAREAGIFRSYKVNGVPVGSILIIPALTTTLHLMIVATIITTIGSVLFRAPLPVGWGGYLLTFVATAVSCAGISVLIGVVSSSSRIQVLWAQLVFLPSMLLGGMMVPHDRLPTAPAKLGLLLPATHAMNAFRSLAMGEPPDFSPWLSILTLLASGVLGFALAAHLFSWDRHNTKRRGHPALALFVLLPFAVGLLLT